MNGFTFPYSKTSDAMNCILIATPFLAIVAALAEIGPIV